MFLSYFDYISIVDIIMVLLFIIAIVIGFKKGFLQKFLDIGSWIVSLILSVIFCGRFSDLLIKHQVIFPAIQKNIEENIRTNGGSDMQTFLDNLGLPKALADYIGPKIDASVLDWQTSMANELANIFMVIISFLFLFIGIWVVIKLLKIVVKAIRVSTVVKIVDDILGVVLYGFLAVVSIYVLMFVLSILMQIPALEGMQTFLINDMQLTTEKFRLSKYFYENNILINLLRIFF